MQNIDYVDNVKFVNLSHKISFNGMVNTSNLMLFDDDDRENNLDKIKNIEKDVAIKYEWILSIVNHIFCPDAQIKLYAIETLIYLFESNMKFTNYLYCYDNIIDELITDLVSIGTNDSFGQQLYRSSSYLLSVLYKHLQCNDQLMEKKELFSKMSEKIFESCAQYDDFACYAIHLASLKQEIVE